MLHRLQCARGFGDWIDGILAFSRSLHSLVVDVPAFACLSALVLITGEWPVLGAGGPWVGWHLTRPRPWAAERGWEAGLGPGCTWLHGPGQSVKDPKRPRIQTV